MTVSLPFDLFKQNFLVFCAQFKSTTRFAVIQRCCILVVCINKMLMLVVDHHEKTPSKQASETETLIEQLYGLIKSLLASLGNWLLATLRDQNLSEYEALQKRLQQKVKSYVATTQTQYLDLKDASKLTKIAQKAQDNLNALRTTLVQRDTQATAASDKIVELLMQARHVI